MNIKGDGWYKMETEDKLKIQLATAIGGAAGLLTPIVLAVGFSIYKRIYIALGGQWEEPDVVSLLLFLLGWPLLAGLVAVIVRWILIYRWVIRCE